MSPTFIHEPTAYIASIRTSLREEQPAVRCLEETGEGVAKTPTVLAHRIVKGITGLVAGSGASKARHRLHLRTEERGGTLGQHETAGFDLYDSRQRLAATHLFRIDLIAVSHITTRHTEDDIHDPAAIFLKVADRFCSLYLYVTLLDRLQRVLIFELIHLTGFHRQPLRQIIEIQLQAQCRRLDKDLAAKAHLISGDTIFIAHRYRYPSIRTRYLLFCGRNSYCCHHAKDSTQGTYYKDSLHF